jgi:threonine synthase
LAYKRSGYILDPHAAAAYGALRRCATDSPAIVLGTAHPAKFLESYESGLRERIEIPEALKEAQLREKRSVRVSNHPEEFKALLLAQ